MSHPIVPIEFSQARPCNKKNRKDLLLKVRLGNLESSLFQALNQAMMVAVKIALKPFYWDGQGFWI